MSTTPTGKAKNEVFSCKSFQQLSLNKYAPQSHVEMNKTTVINLIHREILNLEITLMLASGAKITIILMLQNQKKDMGEENLF